ncbi:hypothetical protein [Sphingosinicella sp.]|uniref:hypothetical protein n=1 Tax=Sphingosinicella sp. TaxID=1917971 RepID=UPI00403812D5
MSLEQASFLAQIISAVAVIASLLFVAVQLRQATKSVRASTSLAHSAMYHSLNASVIEDAEFARIWRESLADPDAGTGDERVRFFAFVSSVFRFYESSRVQWLNGQLDEEHWQTIESQATSFAAQPGVKAWWTLRRHWHSDEFRRWFEGLPISDSATLYGAVERSMPVPPEGAATGPADGHQPTT